MTERRLKDVEEELEVVREQMNRSHDHYLDTMREFHSDPSIGRQASVDARAEYKSTVERLIALDEEKDEIIAKQHVMQIRTKRS